MPAQRTPLVLVSNRGPVTFHAKGEVQRGSGGLVTALTGLASHREVIWIASAMNEYDAEVSKHNGGHGAVRELVDSLLAARGLDPEATFHIKL